MAEQTPLTLNLAVNEKTALETLLTRVWEKFGSQVLRAALFGSKARGDSNEYSDLDLLLIVTDDHWKFQQPLIEIGAEVGLEYDVLFDLRIISEQRWRYLESIQAGLYRNINRDSVPLAG
jgi:predicted nucleotidyltransferase